MIVIDGHSVDDTVAIARRLRPDVRIVRQTRLGKGNALACGFEAATGDVIAMVDADGSADPGEIPRFVRALLDGADFAKGTRFVAGGGSSDITRLRRLGNRMLAAVVNLSHGTHYSDLCYGFNVFWQKHVPVLGLDTSSPPSGSGDGLLWGDGFEIETLIHLRVAQEGLRVAEVPSFEHPRIYGVSNLDAVSDGLRVLRTILVELRGTRRRRARRRASGALVAVAPARGLIRVEKTLVRMLFALPSIDRARPCVHRGQRRSQRVQRSWHCQLLAAGPTVYIGSRDAERGRQAAARLGARMVQLDVTEGAVSLPRPADQGLTWR